MDILSKLFKNELVKGFSYIALKKKKLYDTCQIGKQVRTLFKSKNHILTEKPLELLYIDLFGLINKRLSGNRYMFVMVDDFTKYI